MAPHIESQNPKRGRPKSNIQWPHIYSLAWIGQSNDELIAASGVSRATFYRWLARGDRRERLERARKADIGHTLAMITQLAKTDRMKALNLLYRAQGVKR